LVESVLVSFVLGGLGAACIYFFGKDLGFIDIPNHRSSHRKPIPKGGGIGILAAFLLLSMLTRIPLLFSASVSIISLFGLLGDRRDISPRLRLTVQFICALLAVLVYFDRDSAGTLEYFLLPVWIFFIVGTANFYNFMDGINGIAAITGAVAFGFLAFFLHLENLEPSFGIISASLAFGCLGFLPFNIPRARVFMGDVGSILLGFVFAVIVFRITDSILDFLCFSSLLFPFYIDELSTMVIRLKNGENLTQAHRLHLYQIVANEKKMAHWKVSLLYGLLQCIVAIGVFSLKPMGIMAVLLFLFLASAGFLLLSFCIRARLRFGEETKKPV